MQEKEMYTLRELYDNLEVPYAKLGKMADMSEGTVTRIRDGYPARRTTLNRLLRAFSTVYGRQLTLENVTGIQIEDKHKQEQVTVPPVSTPTIDAIPKTRVAQIRNVEPKRGYKPRKSDLPDGAILASKFAESHGVKRPTFIDHMLQGLGMGQMPGPDIDDSIIPIRDHVKFDERNKRVRKDGTLEKERYLTSDQQRAALEFWKRHDVSFTECDQAECTCHIPSWQIE